MIYHCSHTDLDGFGCQLVSSKYFDEVQYFNADYSDITEELGKIVDLIQKDDKLYITDLNLNASQAEMVDRYASTIGFDVELYDHHITGLEQAEEYEWYHLDTSICATKIFYNAMCFKYGHINSEFSDTIDMINTYDMWQIDDKLFRKSQLLSDVVFNYKIDSKHNTKFKIQMIDKIGKLLRTNSVGYCESVLFRTISQTLSDMSTPEMKKFIDDKTISTSVKLGTFPAQDIDDYLYFNGIIEDIKVKVYKDISGSTSQYGFAYMFEHLDLSDTVLVKWNSFNDTISCRSTNNKAVKIAKMFGGGGHKNAAGANCENFEFYLN